MLAQRRRTYDFHGSTGQRERGWDDIKRSRVPNQDESHRGNNKNVVRPGDRLHHIILVRVSLHNAPPSCDQVRLCGQQLWLNHVLLQRHQWKNIRRSMSASTYTVLCLLAGHVPNIWSKQRNVISLIDFSWWLFASVWVKCISEGFMICKSHKVSSLW